VDRDPKHLNYYERLGISEDADPVEIAAAYKALKAL
jgi:curved DNA-binding protein CbpA